MKIKIRIVRVQYIEIMREGFSVPETYHQLQREVSAPNFEDDHEYDWETDRIQIQDAWPVEEETP